MEAQISRKKIYFVLIAILVILLGAGTIALGPFASNDAGEYQIVQTRGGTLWVQSQPKRWYWTGFFAKVTTYPNNVTIQVGPEDKKSPEADYWEQQHTATFAGGDKAGAGHTVKWNTPRVDSQRIAMHKEYTNIDNLMTTTLLQYQKETFNYSTQRMESEDHYSGGNAQLKNYFDDQLKNGHVLTKSRIETSTDSSGHATTKIIVEPVVDENDEIIRNTSDIQKYGITPSFVSIDYIDYDERIKEKLKEKIDAAADESTSKARLITAQQEEQTAIVEGRKLIAETRAKEEAAEQEAVIRARKEKLVAQENVARDKAKAESTLALKKAEAEGDKLKVQAGLSPKEKAEWAYKTHVDGMKALADGIKGANYPRVMTFGNGDGSPTNPIEALGIKAMLDISKELDAKKSGNGGQR